MAQYVLLFFLVFINPLCAFWEISDEDEPTYTVTTHAQIEQEKLVASPRVLSAEEKEKVRAQVERTRQYLERLQVRQQKRNTTLSAVWNGLPKDLKELLFERYLTREWTHDTLLRFAGYCGYCSILGWRHFTPLVDAHEQETITTLLGRTVGELYPGAYFWPKVRWTEEHQAWAQRIHDFNLRRSLERCAMRRVKHGVPMANAVLDIHVDNLHEYPPLDIRFVGAQGYVCWLRVLDFMHSGDRIKIKLFQGT